MDRPDKRSQVALHDMHDQCGQVGRGQGLSGKAGGGGGGSAPTPMSIRFLGFPFSLGGGSPSETVKTPVPAVCDS